MAQHQPDCDICEQIAACRAGEHPRMIAEMESGFAVLGPHQFFVGYSLLLCSEPATEVDDLEPLFCRQFLHDLTRLSRAVRRVVRPHKVNLESLGNVCHHLHWHVFPRFLEEEQANSPVWNIMPEGAAMEPYLFRPETHQALILAIRTELSHG